MRAADYLFGALVSTFLVGGAGLVAGGVRRRLLPGWVGAPARLGEAVLALAGLEVLLQALALGGVLRRAGLTTVAVLLVLGGMLLRRADRARPRRATGTAEQPRPFALPSWQFWLAVASGSLVVGLWLGQIAWTYRNGIYDYDSIDYHLPVALEWYQTGRLGGLPRTTPDLAVPSYPFGSELFHAAGMVAFGRDVLTPLINLGWLALLLLAGWVAGIRHRVPGVTFAAVAVVAGLPQIAHLEAGAGLSDMPALAALLAATALLVFEYDGEARSRLAAARGVPLVAGLAAGLAVGAKLTAGPAMAAATVAVGLVGVRRLLPWLAGAVAAGGIWFARSWLLAGSPFPALQLPVLPRPEYALFDAWQQSVSDYLLDRQVMKGFFTPALEQLWGPTWPYVIVLSVGGGLLALALGRGAVARALGLVALLCAAGYLVMPHAAGGPPGVPFLFGGNLRFALPALTLGLLAAVLGVSRWRVGPPVLAAAFVVPLAAGAVAHWRVVGLPYPRHLTTGLVALAVGLALAGALRSSVARRGPRPPRWLRPVAVLMFGAVVLAAGFPVFSAYLRNRYTSSQPGLNTAYALFRDQREQRIGVVGIAVKYPYAGADLSNEVDYVGRKLPYGGFTEAMSCREWRTLLRDGAYGWVVVSPSPIFPRQPEALGWTEADPAARVVLRSAGVTVFRLDAPPDPARCR